MTNTTKSPYLAELFSFSLASAESSLQAAKDKMIEAMVDPSYAVQWHAEKLVRAGFRVRALSRAKSFGAVALTGTIADAISDTSSSTSEFANATGAAERIEALALLAEFRPYLDAEVLLDRF